MLLTSSSMKRKAHNSQPEAGETGEYLPYRRSRRKPNSRPAIKGEVARMIAKDNEKLLLVKRFIDLYNEGDITACKHLLQAHVPLECYIDLAPLGIIIRRLTTLFALMDAIVSSFPDGVILASDTTVNHEAAVHTRFKFTGVQVLDFTDSLVHEIVDKEEAMLQPSSLCIPCGLPSDIAKGNSNHSLSSETGSMTDNKSDTSSIEDTKAGADLNADKQENEDESYVDNDRFLALTRVIEQDIAEQLQQPLLLSSNQLTVVRPNSVEFVGIVELSLNVDFSIRSILINRSITSR